MTAHPFVPGAAPISVLIVEDDEHFRDSFVASIQAAPDLRLVGVAADLPQGLALLDAHRPDVLLTDLGLPSGSGIHLIRHAHEHLPDTDAMVISVFGDEPHVMASLEAGATGYLLKDTPAADLADQIRALRAGGSPISPVIARQLLLRLAPAAEPAAALAVGPATAAWSGSGRAASPGQVTVETRLSAQECQVLTLSAKGFSFEEIAQMLHVSRHTVMTYVKRSYRKLQVHSKTEAIYEARKLGWVHD